MDLPTVISDTINKFTIINMIYVVEISAGDYPNIRKFASFSDEEKLYNFIYKENINRLINKDRYKGIYINSNELKTLMINFTNLDHNSIEFKNRYDYVYHIEKTIMNEEINSFYITNDGSYDPYKDDDSDEDDASDK